ncbi:MAG: hypothetical protein HQM08_26110 [Candidatus Riflebacteria bacterium]|nr:hypothetical protein [Candidatus Riflebacteria bacterium]
MGLDIRLPIGAMFLIIGALLTVYGLLTCCNTELYAKSLAININLWWGLIMSVFGFIMTTLGLKGMQKNSDSDQKKPSNHEESASQGGQSH